VRTADFGVQAGNNRMFELVLTTSKLDDQRRGAKVRSGEREIIGADALSVYRVWLPGEN
jgi:glycogen operon protein